MKNKENHKSKEAIKTPQINLLETNIDFDENIYFNHYFSAFGKLDFKSPITERQIPYLMSSEFLYSYFEVKQNIKPAIKETIPQIIGRIKQFSNSLDPKFNMAFFDNIKSYSEILGLEETKNKLIPVLVKIVVDKTDVKIHFLKVLHQNFIDYLCSLGDEGINILRQNIIQIIQELYRDKNVKNESLNILLFKVFIKIAKSIIHKEKDKNDSYMLDLVMSFGYESNVSKDFYLEHKKICIRFISALAEDFGQDWAENHLLPQMWFFACDEEEDVKQEVLIALPNLCQELRYEMIGTKIFKLIKKLSNDKLPIIRQGTVAALAKIIKIYKEKSKASQQNKNKNENEDNFIKLDPGSVKNFLGLIEKLILDKEKCVRDSIIEYIGEIINPLEKEELPQKIFDFYKNAVNEFYYNKEMISSITPMSSTNTKNKTDKKEEKDKDKKEKKEKDKKENVNYYFAYNFPAILYCYGKEVWTKLSPLFTNLCKEKDIKVRRSIIASFHEVSKIVGEKITEEELLPLYDNFLNSKSALEKNFAIKNLPKILSNVNKEIKEKYFKYFDAVSIFQQNMGSKVKNFFFINWRNKIDVIEGILCYYHLYDKDIIYKSILPQCINFCFDDVYKVRSVSCKILATLILYLYNENYKKYELFELLELFALNKKYYQRVCFSKMCKVLLENMDLYNEKIKSLLYILVNNDKSKNVRVALSKALAKIFKQNKFKILNEISFHKICKILNDGKNISITNIFSNIELKNCDDANDEEIFDLNNINDIIGNKPKIFDKENSFIKKEFDFDINECQHRFPKREIKNKDDKKIKIENKNKEDEKEIKNEKINIDNKEIREKNEEKEEIIEEKKEEINNDLKEIKNEDNKEEEIKEIKEEIKEEIKKEDIKVEEIKVNKEEEEINNLNDEKIKENEDKISEEKKEEDKIENEEENNIEIEKIENVKKEEESKIGEKNTNEEEKDDIEKEINEKGKIDDNENKIKEEITEENKNENNIIEDNETKIKDINNNITENNLKENDIKNNILNDNEKNEEKEEEEKENKEQKEEKEEGNTNNNQNQEGNKKKKKNKKRRK